MDSWYFNMFLFDPLALFSGNGIDPEKLLLIRIIAVLSAILILIIGWGAFKYFQKKRNFGRFFRFLKKVKIDVHLDKDRLFRPHVLTITIRNIGKHEADLDAPILEFRKIWTKRKFKLNGIKGQQVFPLFLNPGITHQMRVETATFHLYDREIKSFYWARIHVSDIDGRKWKSNSVKLRKSLVT
ncbi:MAG: hypothetical protein K0M40_18705 [Prolixibacteraceae bacterium]|nr:hypothetical protein [Prolixibacteraceae bacterium]